MNTRPQYYKINDFNGNFEKSNAFVKSYIKNGIDIKLTASNLKIFETTIDEYTVTVPKNDTITYLSITDRSNSSDCGGMRLKIKWDDHEFPGNKNKDLSDMISPNVELTYLGCGGNFPPLSSDCGITKKHISILKSIPEKNIIQIDCLMNETFFVWFNIQCYF